MTLRVCLALWLATFSGCLQRAGGRAATGVIDVLKQERQPAGVPADQTAIGLLAIHTVDGVLMELSKPAQRERLSSLIREVLRSSLAELGPELERLEPAFRQLSSSLSEGLLEGLTSRREELTDALGGMTNTVISQAIDAQAPKLAAMVERQTPRVASQLGSALASQLGISPSCPPGDRARCVDEWARRMTAASMAGASDALAERIHGGNILGFLALAILALLVLSMSFSYLNRKAALRAELAFWRKHERPRSMPPAPLQPAPQA